MMLAASLFSFKADSHVRRKHKHTHKHKHKHKHKHACASACACACAGAGAGAGAGACACTCASVVRVNQLLILTRNLLLYCLAWVAPSLAGVDCKTNNYVLKLTRRCFCSVFVCLFVLFPRKRRVPDCAPRI